jgi:type I restriction enzyme S subunit
MASEEWKNIRVEDVAAPIKNALVGGPFGSNLVSADYVSVGIPVIRGQNMGIGRWVDGEFAFVSNEKAEELFSNTARRGDIIFTQRGTLGQVAIVPMDSGFEKYIISQSQMKLTVDPAKADTLFLYYVFTSPEQQEYIHQNTIQTGVPHTNLGILRKTPILLPPLAEQKAIAHILGTLDDKIEFNRRMNETLEALARTLFTSWFVDFDPVRAKAAGRQPAGMDEATAALFPDGLEELRGKILPNGWTLTSLDEVFPEDKTCVLTGPFGSNLHASDYRDEGVPLILVKHVGYGSIDEEEMPLVGAHKLDELERYRLQEGDIVFTRVGAVGRSSYIFPKYAGWLISGQMLRVRISNSKLLNPRYLAQIYLQPAFIEMVESFALGSTRASLNTSLLRAFEFINPPPQLQDRYGEIVTPFDSMKMTNLEQIKTLQVLRDVLLPKLLAGELRVREAERLVEEAL